MPQRKRNIDTKVARLNKSRPSRSSEAIKKRGQRHRAFIKSYISRCLTFSDLMTTNKGRHRSPEENKFLVYAIITSLRRHLKAMDTSSLLVNWNAIDEEVARDFHVRHEYIRDLREAFHEDGEVLWSSDTTRGFSPGMSPITQFTKIFSDHKKAIASFIDSQHSEGKGVWNGT